MAMTDEPGLAPPGAGLPKAEQFVTRWILFPVAGVVLDRRRALALYESEGRRILGMARGLDQRALSTRVLIPRVRGIEDSSRDWSVAMVLEHLLIVGSGIRGTILSLSRGQVPELEVRIENVKPSPSAGPEAVDRFADWLAAANDGLDAIPLPAEPRLPHPWFGPMTAAQWMKLNAVHNRIHRVQIERIVERL